MGLAIHLTTQRSDTVTVRVAYGSFVFHSVLFHFSNYNQQPARGWEFVFVSNVGLDKYYGLVSQVDGDERACHAHREELGSYSTCMVC